MSPWVRWIVRGILGLIVAAVVVVVLGYRSLRHELPHGTPGPEAEALAGEMIAAVNGSAWVTTGALRWSMAGRREHLWDRARMFDEVRHGEDRVLIDLTTREGRAWHAGIERTGAERRHALDEAYAAWANDSFWLNPVVKVYDQGVTRSLVHLPDGTRALLVSYHSGGVTPGDSYLWIPGPDGRPKRWRMWVHILPIPGMEATWEGWQRIGTGALVSTEHHIAWRTLRLTHVAGAATLGELVPGPDPFAALTGS